MVVFLLGKVQPSKVRHLKRFLFHEFFEFKEFLVVALVGKVRHANAKFDILLCIRGSRA